ncbi:N-acetylmannosamine-6-phosphate 2-epimerase [Francisella sp. 19X1-34]|uniref:N-acetylmannosamine-6-phosphate 2-epimerase n=1 Tax=Francisella sp. 19X1-34 TaxID=3087177 RepID=UPI002E33E57E|nr:N-acetylmannosamine-6-phosphate 2-epimerase [Francisella sp. 19X1-34]MED7789207.1 N-acetylmannosamine-6-phosphate 2-epimerase [Francisella sp. 19X1-34]
MKKNVTDILPRGVIVSCQALEDEPLHSSFIMSKMALAAKQGGAVAIRANSKKDILAIKEEVDLPIIGILKKEYPNSEVFITPTMKEVVEIASSGVDIIAIDATSRIRPDSQSLKDLVTEIKTKFPQLLLMADCSNFEEGVYAQELGFDLVATTLSGYTSQTKGQPLPNIELIRKLAENLEVPVIAEGGISTHQEAISAYDAGAYALVIGSAITRPQLITKGFVEETKGYSDD